MAAPQVSAQSTQRRIEAWLARADARPAPWLFGVAFALALQISPLWYPTPDGAAYLSIARSIANGGPIARFGSAELGYPPGYPMLISAAFSVAPRPFMVLSIIQWVLAVLFALGVYRWLRRQLGDGALWLTAFVMANASIWTLNRSTLTEPAFLAVMIWIINVLDTVLRPSVTRESGLRGSFTLAVAALGVVMLTAIREVGLFVAAGFALAMLARTARGETSQRRAGAALLAGATAIGVAFVAIRPERMAAAGPALAGNLSGYLDAASAVGGGFAARLLLRVTELGQLIVPGMTKAGRGTQIDINSAIYALVFVAVAVGWWRFLRRRGDVFAYAAPVYFAVLLLWPYAAGTRYVVPLLPLAAACLWTHIESRGWRLTAVTAVAAAHLVIALGYWRIIDLPRARACAQQWAAVERIAAAIGATSGEMIAADVPPCMRLMLSLELDRAVHADDGFQARAGAQWLVAAASDARVDGFGAPALVGDYAVFRRQGAP